MGSKGFFSHFSPRFPSRDAGMQLYDIKCGVCVMGTGIRRVCLESLCSGGRVADQMGLVNKPLIN